MANSEAIAEIDVVELGVEVGLMVLQVCHEFLGVVPAGTETVVPANPPAPGPRTTLARAV